MSAIAAEGLRYAYAGAAAPALDGLTFTLGEGEFCALLGPNGAGKTTFLATLCGLLAPDEGRVTIFGHAPRAPEAKALFGWCPQELALYPTLTVREHLALFADLAPIDGPRRAARIDAALELSALGQHAGRRVETFSGGMKRRLNLAIAVLHEPRLLMLDEPTVGVDPQSRSLIFDGLAALHRAGTSILYTTHQMDEAERLCPRIAIVDRGHIIADGAREALLGAAHDAAVRRAEKSASLEDLFLDLTGRSLRD